MPITIQNAVTLPFPEIPYDKVMINLSCSPVVNGTELEASISILLTPYRVLPDGTIDSRPDKAIGQSFGRAFEASASDPILGEAITTILTALQIFIVKKGL